MLKLQNYQGLPIQMINQFAFQILLGLNLLQNLQIIHCDLKPENILLTQNNSSKLKIIDLGSSCFIHQKMYSYIQSRFYRAPEIILGLNYSTPIDIWSFGCILAELFLGRPLFPGRTEYEQIAYIVEMFGVPPQYLIDRSSKKQQFFNQDNTFILKPNSRGKIRYPHGRSLHEFLKGADSSFLDLIKSNFHLECLEWDPEQRITASEALNHPWIVENSATPELHPDAFIEMH